MLAVLIVYRNEEEEKKKKEKRREKVMVEAERVTKKEMSDFRRLAKGNPFQAVYAAVALRLAVQLLERIKTKTSWADIIHIPNDDVGLAGKSLDRRLRDSRDARTWIGVYFAGNEISTHLRARSKS